MTISTDPGAGRAARSSERHATGPVADHGGDERASAAGTEPETGTDRLWNTPVGMDPGFVLARANALSLQRLHRALKALDLRVRSYSLLAIAATDARPSQRELSEFLRLDPSQIVALVDELERRKLVRREPDPRDRRAKVVVATELGRELAARAQELVNGSDQDWFARVPEADRTQVLDTLRKLATQD